MGSCHEARGSAASDANFAVGGCGRAGRGRWTPIEIAAMVLGFILFWPVGLAILLAKLWQRSHGDERDLVDFARERVQVLKDIFHGAGASCEAARYAPSSWRSSGNRAFDAWREAELARLERERARLAQAEREFAEHIEELRRARDREEFESFMRARTGGSSSTQ